MKNKIWLVVLLALCAFIPSIVFAETVVLKSGKIVEGKIVEKTDKYLKMEFEGVVLTYFLDDIARIDEKKKVDSAFSENTPKKQDLQTEESNATAATLGDGSAGVQQFNKAYYSLISQGFQKLECELTSNVSDSIKDMIKSKYPGTDPKSKMFDSVKIYMTFDREAKLSLDYTPTPTGDEKIDKAVEEYIKDIRITLKRVFYEWSRFVLETDLINPKNDPAIEKLPNGYSISYKDTTYGLSGNVLIDNKLRMSKWTMNYKGSEDKMKTFFINSKQGYLLQSFEDEDVNSGFIVSATISYQEVDGLQMPKQATISTSSHKQEIVKINFSNYKIKKIP